MENLLHILKLIKQTKCEKQAKLPSTLQSRYTRTHKHKYIRRNANTLNNRKKIIAEGETYTHKHTHVQLNIYTVITSCGSQSAAGTGR